MAKTHRIVASLAIIITILGLTGCQFVGQSPIQQPSSTPTSSTVVSNFQDRQQVEVEVGTQSAEVEVVNTETSIVLGLSGRNEIGSDGMLFILPTTQIQSFWMKDMKFNLDMIWLKDNQVVDISYNVPKPAPTTPLSQLPLIKPKQPANMVLEVVAGQAQNWGVQIGDQLVFK